MRGADSTRMGDCLLYIDSIRSTLFVGRKSGGTMTSHLYPRRVARTAITLSLSVTLILAMGRVALAVAGGTELWNVRYNGPANGPDEGSSVAYSANGSRVFVTGYSTGATTGEDYVTAAYNAATGTTVWVARYNGPMSGEDEAYAVTSSPDNSKVFVTGYGETATAEDYVTIAYNASTGARLWLARYNGPGSGEDEAYSLAASPDGSKVFVTGYSAGTAGLDYATVAYDAATGAKRWEARYNGPANGDDEAVSVIVSRDGARVFVTGYSAGTTTSFDYATVAYDAVTGATIWEARYNGPRNRSDYAESMAVSPDGTKVFVSGYNPGNNTGQDYSTVGYDAVTGNLLWDARYDGPADSDYARAVAPSPDGTTVFVTGDSSSNTTGKDAATVAYVASTGARRWVARYNGPGNRNDYGRAIVSSPDGTLVFVTGASSAGEPGLDYATLAYDSATGAAAWVTRYTGAGRQDDFAYSIATSPDGSRVSVTGSSPTSATRDDLATVTYAGRTTP
jgi:hypothetical protein